MNGLTDCDGKEMIVMEKKADTALVIGIHREELAFGKQVAAILQGSEIHVVQIDTGLSHKRSHYRSGFYQYGKGDMKLYSNLDKKQEAIVKLYSVSLTGSAKY